MSHEFLHDGATHSVSLQTEKGAFTAKIGETALQGAWLETSPGRYLLRIDGRNVHATVARVDGRLFVHADGVYFELTIPDAGAAAGGADGAESGQVTPPMPGTVVKLLVKPGDAVTKGQSLIVMESMKMESTLYAPIAATVKALHCKPGDLVQPGDSLVDLTPAEA